MAILRLNKISKIYGSRTVLEDVSFEVEKGEKIGLVGANGSGKTTIFRIITGEVEPDSGDVTKDGRLRIAFMPQSVEAEGSENLLAYVLSARSDLLSLERELNRLGKKIHDDPEDGRAVKRLGEMQEKFETQGGYRFHVDCEAVLAGLGFSPAAYETPVESLSGGERTKAALARVLLEEADLLLLDEPTNHLDLWASAWLENFLRRSSKSLILVSHDRYLLNRVPGKIVELTAGRTRTYKGNYDAYAEERDRLILEAERMYEKEQAFIRKEEEFIRRYHYGQRAREARGRRKKLDRFEIHEKIAREKTLALRLEKAAQKSNLILRMSGVSKAFGGRRLFHDVDFSLQRGDRVGLIGPNGTGKTTFLKLVVGEEEPSAGEIKRGRVKPGYYDQEQRSLRSGHTVLEELAEVRPDLTVSQLRSEAGRFLFSGEDVFKRVEALSGGEKARLALAKLVLTAPSFLVLDEPTNHLDIPAREAVEEALYEYDGTILLVTHDRRLLDTVVDTLLVLKDGRIRSFPGSYTEWREHVEAEEKTAGLRGTSGRRNAVSEAEAFRRAKKEKEREARKRRRRLQALEERIEALEARHAEIMGIFEDPALYEDREEVARLTAESARIKDELERAYEEWEALEGEDK